MPLGFVNLISIFLFVVLIAKYIHYILRKYSPVNVIDMDMQDAKFMRTDRRPGTIDVHPTLNALVLNYELEVQILASDDMALYGEKTPMKKIIELPMLNTRVDCNTLGKEVLANCDLIHPSRIPELEQIIFYLKKRKVQNNIKDVEIIKKSCYDEKPIISKLNEYIELLYEDLPQKIKGSNIVLQLAKDGSNLEALSKNETVLSALARVLREDWKKSIVLSTNLVFTFFCFSTYSNFHHVILQHKIGSLCMDVIDYELRRHEELQSELGNGGRKNGGMCPSSASMSELHRSRIPEPIRPRSGNFSDFNLKEFKSLDKDQKSMSMLLEGSVYDDLSVSTESIDERQQRNLSDAERLKKYRTLVRKQDGLLRVAFYLLLNIAEDEAVEEKMVRRDIVYILVRALDRENEELLVLCVTFLKKLSIIHCNKDTMAELDIIDKLQRLLNSNTVDLVHLTLKLLFNLSFDIEIRQRIAQLDYLPRLVSLLRDHKHQEIVIKLLYHLSFDESTRSQFTDSVALIADMLLLSSPTNVDQVLVALCINLALNQSNSEQMAEPTRLQALIHLSFVAQDTLLMKLLHNIAEHDSTRAHFVEFVGNFAKTAKETKNEDLVIECLGILSNLHLADLDWAQVFEYFDLTNWVLEILKSNSSEPDLLLQIIVLLGTAVHDEGCAIALCKTDIYSHLIELLKTHQEDDEIVLQIVFVFLITLTHRTTVKFILENTEAAAYLIDLVQDGNLTIRKVCNECLNVVAEQDASWAERIRIERFRTHNAQWLQMVDAVTAETGSVMNGDVAAFGVENELRNGGGTGMALEDDHELGHTDEDLSEELPPYLNVRYLSTAIVPTLNEINKSHNADFVPPSFQQIEKPSVYEHSRSNSDILEDFEMDSM